MSPNRFFKTVALVLTVFLLVPNEALAKKSKSGPPMGRYVLTLDEILKLSKENQASYFKYLLRMVAQVELQVSGPMFSEAKSASLREHFFRSLIEFAEAADSPYAANITRDMLGLYCIYGAYATEINKTGKSGTCGTAEQGLGKCDPIDKQEAFQCNPSIFLLPTGKSGTQGDKICVTHKPKNNDGKKPGLTYRCVEEYEKLLGGKLDKIIPQMLEEAKNDTAKKAALEKWLADMKKAFNDFEKIAYKGVGFEMYCNPDAPKLTNGKVNYNQINAKADGTGKQNEECEALLRLKWALKDSGVCIDGSTGSACPPTPPSPPPLPTPTPKPTGCNEEEAKKRLGALACVACGIESITEKSVYNWVSLSGSAAQIYFGPYDANSEDSKRNFQRRVIEMMSANSYCTDEEYPLTNTINNHSTQIKGWLDGKEFSTKLIGHSDDEKAFSEAFGIRGDTPMMSTRALFKNSPANYEDYDKASLVFRNVGFRRQNAAYDNVPSREVKGKDGKIRYEPIEGYRHTPAYRSCRQALDRRLNTDNRFAMCTNVREKEADKTVLRNNKEFCKALAKSCKLDRDIAKICKTEPATCPKPPEEIPRGGHDASAPAGTGPGGKGGAEGGNSSGGGTGAF